MPRGNDPDSIHDLRVASRRLQQILDLLYPAPRSSKIRKLRRRIRSSRRARGDLRNCDVQLARANRVLTRKRAARRETWEAVRDYLVERRSECYEKAAGCISRLNLAVLYVRLKDVLSPDGHLPAPRHHEHPEPPTPEQLLERLRALLEPLWHAFEALVAESQRDTAMGVIHGVRIAAKRLRYLLEVAHELDVAGSKATLAWLRKLQQHLGNWHDLEVLEQMLIEMVARPEFLRDHLDIAMGVGKLITKNRKGKGAFRQKYFQMTVDAPRFEGIGE